VDGDGASDLLARRFVQFVAFQQSLYGLNSSQKNAHGACFGFTKGACSVRASPRCACHRMHALEQAP
jgi:hypothetical protein